MITIIEPSWSWIQLSEDKMEGITKHLEQCGRACYQSEDRITDDSADKFVKKICRNHHESVLEHECLTAKIICSRSCSHQLVRHRLAAYSQSSQRFINYNKKGYQIICPPSIGLSPGTYTLGSTEERTEERYWFLASMGMAFGAYEKLLKTCKPEDARSVLPNATATEVVATFNLRMWRHVIKERALNKHAQWEIRGILHSIYTDLKRRLPAIFGDLE